MEQKTYDKFACWCDKQFKDKAAAIDLAKETIDTTQREIIELKGKLGELGATIKQLNKEIAENQEATKEATGVREKENEDYEAEKTEAEQCLGALEGAIKVLSGAGKASMLSMKSAMQEAQLLSLVAPLKGVLRRVPDESTVKEDDLNLMNNFVANPTKFVSFTQSANPHGDYAPASDQIVGIMKGMYDSFAANLEKANAEEGSKQMAFEELMGTKMQELATLKATLEQKTKENADAEKALADANVLLEETKNQLAADEKFFEETKAACKAKAAEWAERTRLRTEEMQGIGKAIEILEGGAETFEAAHSTFIQVSATVVDQERSAAYGKLRALVRKGGGLRLAFLAAELRSGGHFDKVITMIDRMIEDLRVEEQEDIKARDVCNNQENALNAQEDDLAYNIKKKGEEKERMEARKKEVIDEKLNVQDQIAAAKTEMEEMLAARNEENAEFKKALKDDTDAVALLEKAIQSITAFYTNNKIPLEFVQKAPEYSVDEDKAPDASFGGPAKSESTGIIAILGMLKEDLEKEIKVAREEEAASQAEYETQKADAQEALDAKIATETALKGEEADLDGKIAETQGEIDGHEEMKGNTADEKEALKPSCEWVKNNFDSRREKRKKEVEGLQEAKSILAGAPAPELLQGGDSFLQRKK